MSLYIKRVKGFTPILLESSNYKYFNDTRYRDFRDKSEWYNLLRDDREAERLFSNYTHGNSKIPQYYSFYGGLVTLYGNLQVLVGKVDDGSYKVLVSSQFLQEYPNQFKIVLKHLKDLGITKKDCLEGDEKELTRTFCTLYDLTLEDHDKEVKDRLVTGFLEQERENYGKEQSQ